MSGSKYFDRIAVVVTALTLVLTVLFMNGSALGIKARSKAAGYEERLFDKSKVHTLDIVMNDWDDMIDNAASEEYYVANVVIDGEAYKKVGIRTKGNTSLSTVATLGSERYSFKIEFDHYDKTKSYHGLDKLSLNNLIQDSTMMKDYLTYTMMSEFGVTSSLCSYVYVTVNGEDWGLYLAVEGVEDAFLERNYGADYGELYKPDSQNSGGARENGGDFDKSDLDFGNKNGASVEGNGFSGGFAPPGAGGGGMPDVPSFGGVGADGVMGSSDVKLQYVGDDIDSYANIWNNAKTDITETDQKRLIGALKELSANEDVAQAVDVEQVIRYFVVHNYVCNGDSYTGTMVHNYYLYEKDGKLAMLPWDYNLAYGTFRSGDADAVVNTPIDSPVDNGSGEDRPMWNWIVSDEEYTQLYHGYFAEFLKNVDVVGIIDNAYGLIKDFVAKDPTAFYSFEEFELGVQTIRRFCQLRSESISLQLENGETTADMSYVDASGITLSDMGSMGGSAMPSSPGNKGDVNDFAQNRSKEGAADAEESGENGTQGGDVPAAAPSTPQGGFDPSDVPSGGGNSPGASFGNGSGNMPFGDSWENDANGNNRPSGGEMQKPGGDSSFAADGGNNGIDSDVIAYVLIAVSCAILGIGLIVVKKYKC